MRILKGIAVAVVAWFLLTIVLGIVWGLLGLSYDSAYSNLYNLAFLPVGAWIGWRVTRPK